MLAVFLGIGARVPDVLCGACHRDASLQAVMWETQHVWDGTDTAIVRFLFIFSYILGIAYIAFSIVLMCYKSAFAPEYQEYTSSPMLDDTYAQEQDSRYPNV